jgi:hypothetical protein
MASSVSQSVKICVICGVIFKRDQGQEDQKTKRLLQMQTPSANQATPANFPLAILLFEKIFLGLQ